MKKYQEWFYWSQAQKETGYTEEMALTELAAIVTETGTAEVNEFDLSSMWRWDTNEVREFVFRLQKQGIIKIDSTHHASHKFLISFHDYNE